jgi:hypothetical protein
MVLMSGLGITNREATAVLKFFTKTNNKTKKIKKRCFFASEGRRRRSRFFVKKYSLQRSGEGRFFVKNPKGLTLTDKPNELTLQLFFEFLKSQNNH